MRSASALYSPCASLSLRSLRLWLSHSRPSLSSHPNLPCARLPTSFPSASPRLHRSFAAPAKAAKKGAAGKKADAPPPDPNRPIDVSFIQALKADPPPKLLADTEYPEWVFDAKLFNPPSLAELRVRRDQGEELGEEDAKRLQKLERKRKIKLSNDNQRKH